MSDFALPFGPTATVSLTDYPGFDKYIGMEVEYRDLTLGVQTLRCVKNDTGSGTAIAASVMTAQKSSQADIAVVTISATDELGVRCRGVTLASIADGSIGWVVKKGPVVVTEDTAGVTANKAVMTGAATAGKLQDLAGSPTATNIAQIVGWAHAALTTTGAIFVDVP